MTRAELTEKIITAKLMKGVKWAHVAEAVGKSKEWTTAALLGQMSLTKEQAEAAANVLGLNLTEEELAVLQTVPYRGSLGQTVPTDPLIYRLYELMQVYGTTIKTLVEEEFGDGIMSAIDFSFAVDRQPDPKGDRVVITLNGKFLPYKVF